MSTARRKSSTTSLSRFARPPSPDSQNRSLDFCNAFWGVGDVGVDVLLARMRGATRTMEELKSFWKERVAIEDDYAKKLSKLARTVLGRDEIGDLRNAIDTIRLETEKQAGFHAMLASQVRTELESTTNTFLAKQVYFKKNHQTAIEKEFKTKQAQEAHVNKAREKYEGDCVRINSYTAQSSLVQGKDLEKITLKLERAQQTVQTNERDFANFSRILSETTTRWEGNWKVFCDSCQDLEEQRMEFMRDNLWAYSNAVSTVCVRDDESCERMRVSLELFEMKKDMENFVREYGTGNQIPDAPPLVNYNTPDAIPSSSSRPTFRLAQYARTSSREMMALNQNPPSEFADEPESSLINTAGIGAGGSQRDSRVDMGAQSTRRNPSPKNPSPPIPLQANGRNGSNSVSPAVSPGPSTSPPADPSLTRRPTDATYISRQSYRVPPPDHHTETIDPTAETYIKVGNNAYRVDPSRDPQESHTSPSKTAVTDGVDPLVRQLEELKFAVNSSGSMRRKSFVRESSPQGQKVSQQPASARRGTQESHGGTSASGSNGTGAISAALRDYRHSADNVVGAHPSISGSPQAGVTASSASRSASPNPPTAAFMIPKQNVPPSGSEMIQEVLSDYQQSLPGERKSISRASSVERRTGKRQPSPAAAGGRPSHSHQSSLSQSQGQNLARPPSQQGHAGIGAHGGGGSRSPSPAAIQPNEGAVLRQAVRRNSFISAPPTSQAQSPSSPQIVRAPSPNPVGITLDPTGRVMHDEMAHHYHQQQQMQIHQHVHQQHQRQSSLQLQHQQQRLPSPRQPSPFHQLQQQTTQHPPRHYNQQQQSLPSPRQPSPFHPPQPPQQLTQQPPRQYQQQQVMMPQQQPISPMSNNAQRRTSFVGSGSAVRAPTMAPLPQSQQPYAVTPPPPPPALPNAAALYQQPVTPAPTGYMHAQSTMYSQVPPVSTSAPMQYQALPVQHQQPLYTGGYHQQTHSANGVQRAPSMYYANAAAPGAHNATRQQQQQQLTTPTYDLHHHYPQQQYSGYQGPSPGAIGRSQSPQPQAQIQAQSQPQSQSQSPQTAASMGQTTEEGLPILFYVKALYDYAATIDEEFDFQQGDIIAVTATPEDGWWSGELLDEERRQKGRYIFPSNFVCLF